MGGNKRHKSDTISLANGCRRIEKGMAKLIKMLEGDTSVTISANEYMNLYMTVYSLSTRSGTNYSKKLYERYNSMLREYLESKVFPSLRETNEGFLSVISARWEIHLLMVRWLSHFFQYLDRFYVPQQSLPMLVVSGRSTFLDMVYREFQDRIKHDILATIRQQHEGHDIERDSLRRGLDLYASFNEGDGSYYDNDLEPLILKEVSDCYARIASNHVPICTLPEYMLKAEQVLSDASKWAAACFGDRKKHTVVENIKHELLVVHQTQLFKEGSGLHLLLQDNKVEDLKRIYELYQTIPDGLDVMLKMFKEHIVDEGQEKIKETKAASANAKAIVGKLIEVYDKYSYYIEESFDKDSQFYKMLREAFEVFCNKTVRGICFSEMLATFCDSTLKKGNQNASNDEYIDELFDKITRIASHINEKDIFVEFYRKKLCNRLLNDLCANKEHETLMILKFKQQFGHLFTNKMEGMLKDMLVEKDVCDQYHGYLNLNPDAKPIMALSMTILTGVYWPVPFASKFNYPEEMVKCIESFDQYYRMVSQKRKLTWCPSVGSCIVVGNFDKNPVELVVSTYQASLLLLFNTSAKLTVEEIQQQLNLKIEEVVKLLQTLAFSRLKILKKTPSNKIISKNDKFEMDAAFTSSRRRIRLPFPVFDENKVVAKTVEIDRRYTIDAALVRIMKSRKVLGHQQLIAECIEQLSNRFMPDVKLLKRQIEGLVTREYLERDASDSNTYRYLA